MLALMKHADTATVLALRAQDPHLSPGRAAVIRARSCPPWFSWPRRPQQKHRACSGGSLRRQRSVRAWCCRAGRQRAATGDAVLFQRCAGVGPGAGRPARVVSRRPRHHCRRWSCPLPPRRPVRRWPGPAPGSRRCPDPVESGKRAAAQHSFPKCWPGIHGMRKNRGAPLEVLSAMPNIVRGTTHFG